VSIFITEVEAAADGPTLAVKDIFDTAGVRTTYGSAIFRDHVPDTTAASVALLRDAGYVMVGKANLHEFAWGITSENDHYGWVPNPAAPGRVAGGSSGGSAAALAAGLVDAALGSDSGGSIRIPAACCGVVGLKVSFGAVPIDGCWPLAPSYDTAGPMARDVAGCERMMEAMVPGFHAGEAPPLGDLRVGVAWLDGADPGVRERVLAATRPFGAVAEVDLPLPEASYPLFSHEAAAVHGRLFAEREAEYGENVASKLRLALKVTDQQAADATLARGRFRDELAWRTDGCDLLVKPTLEMVAPPSGIGDLALRGRMIKLTYPFNATGAPALALPAGPAEDGLPASVQLVGRPGDDAFVLAAGRALEAALNRR
jgi:aspartyl-tRNA(Asn)/glutamyl-tRNA(Gln) amidotransferase subunit A